MESHTNIRLLFVALCLVISANSAKSRFTPDASPVQQTATSSSESVMFSFSSSGSEPKPKPEGSTTSSQNLRMYGSVLHAANVNPEVKKICDQTDHSSLCVDTILPHVPTNPNVNSVLLAAVQAGSEYAKQASAEAKKLAEKPGTPEDVLSTLKDCQSGYDTAVENFQKSLDAFANNDMGTMNSMLSAVITFVGDCQDEFTQMQIDSPMSSYAAKLTEMASNCLAISSLKT